VTREAVVDGFEYFLDDAVEASLAEFSVARAVRKGTRGPAGAVVDSLLKNSEALHQRVVRPELDAYRRQTLDQFRVILDCMEADKDLDEQQETILSTGAVAESIRSDIPVGRRNEVKSELLSHHRGMSEAVKPLLASPESEFWAAATAELSRDEAEALVSEHFAFTGPLRRNRDAFEMATTVDVGAVVGGFATVLPQSTIEVEYTDEAIRAMYRAEQSVVQGALDEIDRRFD
jgi:hypothetical protein